MAELLTVSSLLAFLTLTTLEIVLGVDNLVFLTIVTGKLPKDQRPLAQKLGLLLAAAGRIVLLLLITWIITLEHTNVFTAFDQTISVKDLILLVGGVFLLGKGTWEIHEHLEGGGLSEGETGGEDTDASFGAVLTQVVLLDLVFSIDSVLTAVGMVSPDDYSSAPLPLTGIPWPPLVIMAAAVIVAISVMMGFAGPLGRFVQRRPTIKMLALSFLLLIGIVLVAEGLHQHIPRGYIYFAMGFSLVVELLNLKFVKPRRKKAAAAASAAAEH